MAMPRALAGLLLAAACVAGCSSTSVDLRYYWQSARGHMTLMQRSRPIAELLGDDALEGRLRDRLERVREIREFASSELGLPANGSYTTYAALGRPFVVWNVFATPELSMELKQWCFPIAGCVGYRGYFDPDDAERAAQSLRARGLEVHVAGVPAYSTLGWFDDPVLSTFVHHTDGELARILFHELAHQIVYVKDDTAFNESFATAVEEAGVRRWLQARADPVLEEAYRRFSERRRQFVALLRRHKAALEEVYRSGGLPEDLRARKAAAFAGLKRDYRALKSSWGGYAGYDRWFDRDLTNAHLASVSAYNTFVPGFEHLLMQAGDDLPRFYEAVRALAGLDRGERERMLQAQSVAMTDGGASECDRDGGFGACRQDVGAPAAAALSVRTDGADRRAPPREPGRSGL